jgi:hypothetical protein
MHGHALALEPMKPPLLLACLVGVGSLFIAGCATTSEASQRVAVQPGDAPATWETKSNDGWAGLLSAALSVAQQAINK